MSLLMRRAIFILAIAGLLRSGQADNDSSDVNVAVKSVEKLDVTDGGTIVLEPDGDGGTMGPVSDETARLNYTHNKTGTMKITAELTSSPDKDTNDITLRLTVNGRGNNKLYDDNGPRREKRFCVAFRPAHSTE
jgi:hypothetical protein